MHQNFIEDKVDLQVKFTEKYASGTTDIAVFQKDLSDLIKLCAAQKNQDGSIPVLLLPHNIQMVVYGLNTLRSEALNILETAGQFYPVDPYMRDYIAEIDLLTKVITDQLSSAGFIKEDVEPIEQGNKQQPAENKTE